MKRASSSGTEARVVCARSGFLEVETDDGRALTCRLRGRLKQGRKESDIAVIGDRVLVDEGGSTPAVTEVLRRTSWLSRLWPGSRGRPVEDVLAANLDRVVVCAATSAPPLNPRLVDRFLAVASRGGVEGLVALTKIDEGDVGAHEDALEGWRRAGIEVIATSARTAAGLDALRAAISGRTVALVGPSGCGKSSLVNALDPTLSEAVGGVSDAVGKGTHTTRVARLLRVGDARVADTPGIRELAPYDLGPRDLGRAFPEIDALAAGCQFRSCVHDHEPGCAVREAATTGALHAGRYDSYLRMLHGDPS